MGIEREATEDIRRQIRLIPDKHRLLDTLIDMQCFFSEMINKKPTKILIGRKQWAQLTAELDSMRMIMMPRDGFVGVLLGMNMVMEGDDRLEITC